MFLDINEIKSLGFGAVETKRGRFFVKNSGKIEANGLETLEKTHTLRVPKVYYADDDLIVMEYFELRSHTTSSMRKLGEQLSRMHLQKGPKTFGYEIDNTIGLNTQINPWTEIWVEFFIENRLRYQLNMVKNDPELVECVEKFLEIYPTFFEGIDLFPSLLHGDLWSGNTAADPVGNPIVFDPAVYYGHHEADFGILLMFGGFTKDFFEAYHTAIPKAPGFEERHRGYQLYHYLNHYNLFGSGYRSGCFSLL